MSETASRQARALLRELNDSMKSPRGDYYQGDIADPNRVLHIIERHLAAALDRLNDCIRDLAHATGPHAPGCYTCKQMMKRHADLIVAALRAAPPEPKIGDLHREQGGAYECWKGSD